MLFGISCFACLISSRLGNKCLPVGKTFDDGFLSMIKEGEISVFSSVLEILKSAVLKKLILLFIKSFEPWKNCFTSPRRDISSFSVFQWGLESFIIRGSDFIHGCPDASSVQEFYSFKVETMPAQLFPLCGERCHEQLVLYHSQAPVSKNPDRCVSPK